MKTAIVFAAVCIVIASAGPMYPPSHNTVFQPVNHGAYQPIQQQCVYHPSYSYAKTQKDNAQIVAIQNDNIGIGGYNFGYETTDGQKREEHAQIVLDNNKPVQVVSGSYSYVGNDGQLYTVNYTADQFGFHPEGAHIPQSTRF